MENDFIGVGKIAKRLADKALHDVPYLMNKQVFNKGAQSRERTRYELVDITKNYMRSYYIASHNHCDLVLGSDYQKEILK